MLEPLAGTGGREPEFLSLGQNEDEHEEEDKDEDADKNDDEDENQNEDENGDARFVF